MNNKIIGIYSIFLGLTIFLMWGWIIFFKTVSEGIIAFSFHLTAEFLMACICIISGILLLMKVRIGMQLNIIGHAMILYAVINAAGYYAQLGEIFMVIPFSVLFLLSICVVIVQLTSNKSRLI